VRFRVKPAKDIEVYRGLYDPLVQRTHVKGMGNVFDVDEMRSNYDRMAEENGQMLVNCANWKRELAAKDAENEALKKEVEKLQECVAVLECELFEAVNNPNYK